MTRVATVVIVSFGLFNMHCSYSSYSFSFIFYFTFSVIGLRFFNIYMSWHIYCYTNTNQLKLKVLIKNCFLYSFVFPCIKAIIYKIRKTLKLYFILNFARLQLGRNLRYSYKYYIAKHLAKFLVTSLTPKTYN